MKRSDTFWKNGIQFECQGSGKCCVSRGEYGFVYLSLDDRRRFARYFKISTSQFTRRYCRKIDGFWILKDNPDTQDCTFLSGRQCAAYEARPDQCRTWPFWPDVMKPKLWAKEVSAYCPGVGKGRIWTKEEIEAQMNIQMRAEELMDRELQQSQLRALSSRLKKTQRNSRNNK